MPVALAEDVLRRGSEHAEWEDFSRLQLARGGELRRYYPLAPEAEAEYQAWKLGNSESADGADSAEIGQRSPSTMRCCQHKGRPASMSGGSRSPALGSSFREACSL
jgi:hypothetical protein